MKRSAAVASTVPGLYPLINVMRPLMQMAPCYFQCQLLRGHRESFVTTNRRLAYPRPVFALYHLHHLVEIVALHPGLATWIEKIPSSISEIETNATCWLRNAMLQSHKRPIFLSLYIIYPRHSLKDLSLTIHSGSQCTISDHEGEYLIGPAQHLCSTQKVHHDPNGRQQDAAATPRAYRSTSFSP